MDIQYKPTKPKKEKPVKAPKAEKAVKFGSTVQTVKSTKPAKAPKAPKAEKAVAFGKVEKVQTDKPVKVEAVGKPGLSFNKVDPKVILGIVLAAIVAIAVVVVTVVLPAVERNGQQIKGIMISAAPEKTLYLVGEEANYDGLRVQVTRNNGETFTVRANKCTITGFDSKAAAEYQTITVAYEGFTTSFYIKVEEPPKVMAALSNIRLETLPKTQYKLGERLDTTGGVISCEYADGTILKVNLVNGHVSGFGAIKAPGTYELTVKYVEQGVVCKTTYTITVTG